MKLLVCLFLIVVLLEEYNCAPYTSSRHRHHHGLRYRSSRHHSPYKSTSIYGHRYRPHSYYMYHPWRDSRHCTWHGPKYSSRHCSALGYWHSSRARYNTRYGTRHFIPNTTPVAEDKPLTVVTPIYKLVDKTTARPQDKSNEELVHKKPVDNLVEEHVANSLVQPTRAVSVTDADHENISEDNTQYKATEKPVEKSTVKSTLTITMTADDPVKIPIEKPQDITIKQTTEKPVEKLTVTQTSAVTEANPVKMPVDERHGVNDEKTLEPESVKNASQNHSDKVFNKPSPNSVNSSSENLSSYSTVSPFGDWLAENLSELSTENPFQ